MIISSGFDKSQQLANKINTVGIYAAENDAQIRKERTLLKRNMRIAENILTYTQKLKNESIADTGQIITISKQRINHPCKSSDVLANVILPENYLKAIEEKLKKLYIGID